MGIATLIAGVAVLLKYQWTPGSDGPSGYVLALIAAVGFYLAVIGISMNGD